MILKGLEIRDKMCPDELDLDTWNNSFWLESWGDHTEELEYKYPDFYKWLTNLELIYNDEKYTDYKLCGRRPYYQMRGKPVTEQQAFEIIRRCDDSFYYDDELTEYTPKEDEIPVGLCHISSWLFMENHFPNGYGWCYPDGLIGTNNICGRYPDTLELVLDFIKLMYHFPYLDAVWAFTYCNEVLDGTPFEDAVDLGFWTHDNKIEILPPKAALAKYKEYAQKYEREAWMYDSDERHKRKNREELRRYAEKCSEANKRDAEKYHKN